MHRKPLHDLLDKYNSQYRDEHSQYVRFKAFVSGSADCFLRSHLPGHVTGSAWLVSPCFKKVLLTHHKKLGAWFQLGGHADGETDVLKAALSEAYEESGLTQLNVLQDEIFDIDIHEIPQRKETPSHFHYDVRFLVQATETDFTVSEESLDLSWVPIDQLEQYTTETSMLRMHKKYMVYLKTGG